MTLASLAAIKGTFWQSAACVLEHAYHFVSGSRVQISKCWCYVMMSLSHTQTLSRPSARHSFYDKQQIWIGQIGPLSGVTSRDKEESVPLEWKRRRLSPTSSIFLHLSPQITPPKVLFRNDLMAVTLLHIHIWNGWSHGLCLKGHLGGANEGGATAAFHQLHLFKVRETMLRKQIMKRHQSRQFDLKCLTHWLSSVCPGEWEGWRWLGCCSRTNNHVCR